MIYKLAWALQAGLPSHTEHLQNTRPNRGYQFLSEFAVGFLM